MGDGNLMSFKRPAKQREIEGYIGNLGKYSRNLPPH